VDLDDDKRCRSRCASFFKPLQVFSCELHRLARQGDDKKQDANGSRQRGELIIKTFDTVRNMFLRSG
jgi:hypothetical protein